MGKTFKSVLGKVLKVPRRHVEQNNNQYGVAHEKIDRCQRCFNVFTKKAWREEGEVRQELRSERAGIHETLCPACKMAESGQYEGELLIENIPGEKRVEVGNLVENFGERERQRDPQHRLLSVVRLHDGFRVTTTENQMAVKIGKKIRDVFHSVRLITAYSREPFAVVRVRAEFRGTPDRRRRS